MTRAAASETHLWPRDSLSHPNHASKLVPVWIRQEAGPVFHCGEQGCVSPNGGKVHVEQLYARRDFGQMVTLPSNFCRKTVLQFCPPNSGKSSKSRITWSTQSISLRRSRCKAAKGRTRRTRNHLSISIFQYCSAADSQKPPRLLRQSLALSKAR